MCGGEKGQGFFLWLSNDQGIMGYPFMLSLGNTTCGDKYLDECNLC
jgi:hypothetical protein